MIKIYHNPRCSKSREALELIQKKDKEVEVIEYLKNPPTQKELKEILGLLKIRPEELVRKGESLYKENFKDKKFTDSQWIKILCEHPVLIERPIVVKQKRATIGRPLEKVLELLKK